MKKILLLVAIMLCCAMSIFAQNNRISYQAVVRDTENKLVANKTVTVTVEIFNGTETTAAYTETHIDVQTNYNGLFSLQIGGGTATGVSWDEAVINWKNAKVTTTVSLGGTQLATLEMPLTAVPYALYADYAEEINPDAEVVTNITNRMNVISDSVKTNFDNIAGNKQAIIDSTAHVRNNLRDTASTLRGLIKATDDKFADYYTKTQVDENMDSVKGHIRSEITSVKNNLQSQITTNATNINVNKQAIIDSTAHVRNNLRDTASTLRGLIKTTDNKFADYYTKTQVDENMDSVKGHIRSEITSVKNNLQSQITTNATNINVNKQAIIDSTAHVRNNLRDTASTLRGLIKTTDNKLATKANAADVYTKSQVYTKTETDNLLNGYVTKNGLCTEVVTCVDNALSNGSSTTNKAIDTIAANITLDILSNGHYVSTSDCPTQDVSICDLVSTVNELTNTIGNLNSAIAGLQSSINDLNEQNAALSERVTELENEMASVVTGKVINLDTLTHDITLTDGYTVTGTLAHNVKITIADDATVTLDGVNINGNGTYTGDHAGITCESDATIILAHGTTNTVKGFHEDYPGIYVPAYPAGSTLTIKGSGSLLASSNGDNAAGIGGGNGATRSCGNIRIEEGTVMATGGAYAAGIGGGKDSDCDDIVITDGVTSVKATKGSNASNSIGAGTGTSKCDGVTFGNKQVYDGTTWTPDPMVSGTYGGLDLTISGNDWTLTEAGSQDPVIEASTFQKCYDCWRDPDYPTQGNTQCKFYYFANPGIGNNTSAGPWKLEYKGSYSSNQNPYNISVGSYQSTYSVVDVPIFELLQWDGSSFQHAAYGVVCAYSSVNNQIDHTAFFEANNYWGCYLTGAEHSEDLYITFDEYLSDGLHSLIPQP